LDHPVFHLAASSPNALKDDTQPAHDFAKVDAFFARGGLTVYASTQHAWRWRACSGKGFMQAVLVDPLSNLRLPHDGDTQQATPAGGAAKRFEDSRLVKWLTRTISKTKPSENMPNGYSGEDAVAFAELIQMDVAEWATLGCMPALTAAQIRCFRQAHNAALSDMESAFLPNRIDLPTALANFYVRYLTCARRDVEASFIVAQSSSSTRLARRFADAVAVAAFEGAAHTPLQFDGNDYAVSAACDTSYFIDKAIEQAEKRLALPIDHADHLLRLSTTDITMLASDIVEAGSLTPFPFLMKAKQLYLARADVCRFPPMDRFATAIAENDLPAGEEWVARIANAYNRLFFGLATPVNVGAEGLRGTVVKQYK